MRFESSIIIVGQGEVNIPLLCEMAKDIPIIALDGALDLLTELGLDVVAVIGDMDSVTDITGAQEVITVAEQDSNDFEKALLHIKAPHIIGFGLFGKRFDHTFANLHVMAKYHDKRHIIAITNDEVISVHHGPTTLVASQGALAAILPLSPIGFAYSTGLSYALDGLSLAIGDRVSSSNQASADEITFVPVAGDEQIAYGVCRALFVLREHDITQI